MHQLGERGRGTLLLGPILQQVRGRGGRDRQQRTPPTPSGSCGKDADCAPSFPPVRFQLPTLPSPLPLPPPGLGRLQGRCPAGARSSARLRPGCSTSHRLSSDPWPSRRGNRYEARTLRKCGGCLSGRCNLMIFTVVLITHQASRKRPSPHTIVMEYNRVNLSVEVHGGAYECK